METRCFLAQDSVLYPKPLQDGWARRSSISIFPASPGQYILTAAWRLPGGSTATSGREQIHFRVLGKTPSLLGTLRRRLRRVRLLFQSPPSVGVPRSLGGGLLFGPSTFEFFHLLSESEMLAMRAVRQVVGPGNVVYDIGANLGLYSIFFARLVGKGGQVLSFEPNPACVSYLRLNLEMNRIRRVCVVPMALMDRDGETVFSINYGNTSLGTAADSGFFTYKAGQEIGVECATLDTAVHRLALPPPDLVKIDVEGTESRVIAGMRQLLREHRPRLLLELHGEGALKDTLGILDEMGYQYQVPGRGGRFGTGPDVLAEFGPGVLHVLAEPLGPDA